jgi:hypothetical protein
MAHFCPPGSGSGLRIRIPNPDPDPLTRLNPDPIRIRIRIRNPAKMMRIHADPDRQHSPQHYYRDAKKLTRAAKGVPDLHPWSPGSKEIMRIAR